MELTGIAPDATKAAPVGLTQLRPAASVVVPCFNGGRFLDALMTSLARQSFRDFEIVIVDDGSTDGETPRKLASLRDRVRVIHQENRGPSAARNTGARAARADILFMLDCDDTMRDGYEDWDFSLRLSSAGYRGIEVPKPLYVYHIGDDARPSRSSGVDKKRLYGELWRHIRGKHAESFRPLAMLQLWRESREGRGKVPLWKGFAAYGLALLLPDALFNQLIARVHRGQRADTPNSVYGGATREPRLA